MSYESRIIQKACKILDKITPLSSDCGKLCYGACCLGDDKTGMQLLPGESELLENLEFDIVKNENGEFCICKGICRRENRPFACRIFPYFPVPEILHSGRCVIRVMPDPRAVNICPLLSSEDVNIQKLFLARVAKAGRILLKSKRTRKWLFDVADEIRSVAEFQVMLSEKNDN